MKVLFKCTKCKEEVEIKLSEQEMKPMSFIGCPKCFHVNLMKNVLFKK